MKKIFTLILAIGMMMVFSVSVFAAEPSNNYNTPAEIVAGLTGRTVESVIAERLESGKTYGTIASEAGMLEKFRSESLKMKKDNLDKQVSIGNLTQAECDAILAAIKANQTLCNAAGTSQNKCAPGTGIGGGRGVGRGQGKGQGSGRGTGGMRLQNGSCYTTN